MLLVSVAIIVYQAIFPKVNGPRWRTKFREKQRIITATNTTTDAYYRTKYDELQLNKTQIKGNTYQTRGCLAISRFVDVLLS